MTDLKLLYELAEKFRTDLFLGSFGGAQKQLRV